jgi:hypothetical protein
MPDIFDQLTQKKSHTENESMNGRLTETATKTVTEPFSSRKIKDAVQELMKFGLLEAGKKPNLYQTLITQPDQVNTILEPLDLVMKIDDVRGLVYLCIAEQESESNAEAADEWSHPLVRRQRLNMEQSLLIALLRQHFIAHELEAGMGASQALVALEDLLPQVQLYLGDMGSDAREQTRLRNLLDKLKVHGLVSEINQHEQIVIRPIIAHVANPENLANLLQAFSQQAQLDTYEDTSREQKTSETDSND